MQLLALLCREYYFFADMLPFFASLMEIMTFSWGNRTFFTRHGAFWLCCSGCCCSLHRIKLGRGRFLRRGLSLSTIRGWITVGRLRWNILGCCWLSGRHSHSNPVPNQNRKPTLPTTGTPIMRSVTPLLLQSIMIHGLPPMDCTVASFTAVICAGWQTTNSTCCMGYCSGSHTKKISGIKMRTCNCTEKMGGELPLRNEYKQPCNCTH